jgi:hypothetical protein
MFFTYAQAYKEPMSFVAASQKQGSSSAAVPMNVRVM